MLTQDQEKVLETLKYDTRRAVSHSIATHIIFDVVKSSIAECYRRINPPPRWLEKLYKGEDDPLYMWPNPPRGELPW